MDFETLAIVRHRTNETASTKHAHCHHCELFMCSNSFIAENCCIVCCELLQLILAHLLCFLLMLVNRKVASYKVKATTTVRTSSLVI